MSMQTKASFKKEITAFTRTKKFLIIACVFIGLAVFDPLMLRGTGLLIDAMNTIEEIDMSGLGDFVNDAPASVGVYSTISDLALIGLLIFLLMMNPFAGGEQKKRSIIIPRTSGLSSPSYLLPKFIVYPAAAFVLSVISAFVSYAVSVLIFDTNDIVFTNVLLGGALLGVYLMMFVCFHLCLGTATGRAGMSSAVCIVGAWILSTLFALIGMTDIFNPFTMNTMAAAVAGGMHKEAIVATSELIYYETGEIIATVLIALAAMVLVYFIALFAQNAKRIDNSGNEVLI